MAERLVGRVGQVGAGKPVPMKLFATWEVERTAPNCIPRLCSLKLARIVVLKPLEESDLNSILIAVRMQNSKRTLRSNEIFLPQGALLDTELDLSFSLQYPHFLKRGNKLRVMLQRRKRYKNRTILGYKTLAVGLINMSEVLQQSKDSELSLFGKEQGRARVAQVTVLGLSSQPVDQFKRGMGRSIDIDMGSEEEEESYSSNDENSDSGENMAEGQDLLGEPEEEAEPGSRKGQRGKLRQPMNRQRNFKQKFISLLKKFKVQSDESDPEHFAFDQDPNPIDEDFLYDDLDDLNLSDSGPEMDPDDEISIGSTPKPQLRPFFSQGIPTSSSMAEDMEQGIEQNGDENGALCRDSGSSDDIPPIDDVPIRKEVTTVRSDSVLSNISDPGGGKSSNLPHNPERSFSASSALQMQKENTRRGHKGRISREGSLGKQDVQAGSATCKPSRSLEKMGSFGKADNVPQLTTPVADQLAEVWSQDNCIPDRIALVSIQERPGKMLSKCLKNSGNKVVQTITTSDVEASLQFIVNKLQKFCNLNPKLSSPLKVALCGSETYVGTVLQPYVEQLSSKSPDWQNYIKFYVVPVGSSSVAKYVGSVDNKYYTLFMDPSWRDFFDKTDRDPSDAKEIASRVGRYMIGGSNVLQLPIGEVMLTCKLKSMDEEWVQKFVPFVNNVRIGPSLEREGAFSSYSLSEQDEILAAPSNQLSSSPPAGNAGNNLLTGAKEKGSAEPLLTGGGGTPPPSPAITNATANVQPSSSLNIGRDTESNEFYASAPLAGELYDLQVEYWPMSGGKKDKTSLKTAFRSLTVHRLPGTGDPAINGLSMEVVTKEKNKKIMRIGKKQREVEPLKTQVIDGIHRLVCTSKSQDCSLKVTIDGIELPRVKFFQLSAQWQTHIKQFPVAVFGHNDTS